MNINYVKYGLANNYGDYIELNENLKKYPELHDFVLNHELGHTDKYFSWQDLKHDLNPSTSHHNKLIQFILRHPSTWTQFLPFYYSRSKGFVYDLNLIIVYTIFLIIIFISFWIGLNL